MGSAVFSSLILLSCVGLLIGYPIDDALPAGDDTANPELAAKTAELKKQALKLLSLRGVKDLKMDDKIKPSATWDDIQITDNLYQDIKSSFDEEQKLLESTPNETERMTAPDFKLIPFAKWEMPIPYALSKVKSSGLKNKIRDAIDEIQTKSGCIKFQEVTSTPDSSYILYREVQSLGAGTCANSPLGRQQSVNVINVATTCQVYGSILHETLHSLGFAHSQQRPDVDQFITIQWQNMIQDPDIQSNFKSWKYALKNQGPFDFGSIMMYPPTAFSANGRDTLLPKRDVSQNKAAMGQRERMSNEDVNLLKKIYCGSGSGSGSSGPSKPSKPTIVECRDRSLACFYWKFRGYCSERSPNHESTWDSCPDTCNLC